MALAVIAERTPERGESKYELWRPIIRAQRRATLERIHQNLAKDWSQRLSELLPRGERIEFEGLGFEAFGNLSETDSADCQTAVFTIEETEMGGFLLIGAELARSFIETRLGVASIGDGNRTISLTRIEHAIVSEALSGLLAGLSDSYHAAGIGRLAAIRHSERLKRHSSVRAAGLSGGTALSPRSGPEPSARNAGRKQQHDQRRAGCGCG